MDYANASLSSTGTTTGPKKSKKLNMDEVLTYERETYDKAVYEYTEELWMQIVSLIIRDCIAPEVLQIVQVTCAIEERLNEMTGEILEHESAQILRTIIEQSIQEVQFTEAYPLVTSDMVETILNQDVISVAQGVLDREQAFHSVG
jgi:predicted DNA-binding protein